MEAAVEDLTLALVETSTGTSKFDLTLSVSAGPGGLTGGLEYNTDLFDSGTADRLLGHFSRLLAGVAADPDQRIWSLPLLSPEERRHLLTDLNAGTDRRPVETTLHRLFEVQAARFPEVVAAFWEGERLTYRELDTLANRWAHRLRDLGVEPEVRVGLCVERSMATVVGILAILKAGGAYVPLDPAYPEERLRFLLADSGVRVLLTQGGLVEKLPAHEARVLDLDEPLKEGPAGPPAVGTAPDNLAYIIYTSGSTGRPKGVGVTHANVVRLFTATEGLFDFGPNDVWTLFHSHAFDFSVWEIWGALLYGGSLVVVPYWVTRSPSAFRELLARERVTVLNQTPSAFRQLIEADAAVDLGELALRYVVFGGEALDLQSLRPWFNRHDDQRPRLVNMYGITETTVHVTWRPIDSLDVERGAASVIGSSLPDLSLAVLERNGEPAPIGVAGEMHVGGAGVARGYLGRPELTAQRFVPDPFGREPGGRLYRSGDLARYLPNGDLEYLGRIDHQVKIRGFRIELGEIEAALGDHPAVRQALVVARDEGEGDRRLVAYLVAGPEPLPGIEELRAFLRKRLPEHMLPAAFVPLDALPLTAHGKIDRAALPAPDRERSALRGSFTPPRTPEEQILAEVWREVLKIDQVGADDNFFTLGGDSILSIRVRSLAARRGLHFELPDLFQHQTLAALAGAVQRDWKENALDLKPFDLVAPGDRELMSGDIEEAYPTSLLQLGMLFHSEREGGAAPYHNVSSFILRAHFEAAALEAAVARLALRHPVLRTSFDSTRFSEPLQLVHREAPISVETRDLRGLPPQERERILAERFEAEKRCRFDWNRPGLLRVWAHTLTDDTFELGVTEHHAIVDGWSFSTLLSELFELYFAELGSGSPPPPPAPTHLFRDFIALERAAVESHESQRFWNERLAGRTVLQLPRWPGRPEAPPEPRVRKVHGQLPAETDEALGRFAAAVGVPLKSALLAAHLRVLELLGGSPDILTGLVTNGRPEIEGGERALGLFLNTLPLRLRLSGTAEETWADLVRAAFEAERVLLPHRRVPLAELQRRSGGGSLFEVTFNYTHFHVLEN
ncbi:MAG TPA: amino acid adenylation domain-containing protein, partial [Thermoanaerobaculia bacterium]|nr:amino acid adenylation domain-containing protein [Thermoanaerobaculia bacterium]